jgi:flavin reductase (DIM6/NTAB) family NADH-FMN oxidoreductase RutF
MPVDAQLFRSIMGSFPAGVTVVTAIDATGTARGLTTTAVSSVSLDPPLLLVCVAKTSNTLPALRHSRAFVANFLAAGQERLAEVFASKDPDKFREVRWRPAPAAGGAPVLEDGCAAHAQCQCVQEIDAGDHVILVGRVEDGGVEAEAAPMLFRQGVYRGWPVTV